MLTQSEESALVVFVEDDVDVLVDVVRRRFDRAAQRGMAAHVTLLYPFRPLSLISDRDIESLRDLFGEHAPFSFGLSGLCGFPGVVYLRPEPLAPFDTLARAIHAQFPEYSPYRGAVIDPVPHLTLAQAPPAQCLERVSHEVLALLGARLPLPCTATRASLAVKHSGRWATRCHFPLGV